MLEDAEPVSVVMASDERFAMPLTVAAYSAIKNFSKTRQMNLFILDGGITEASKKKISDSISSDRVTIQWIQPEGPEVDEIVKTVSGRSNYPPAAFYRLILPELIPEHVRKIIHLDCDVIVLHDIAALWSLDAGDSDFLAVQEPNAPYLIPAFREFNANLVDLDLNKFGITPEHKYFNSGVMLINLQRWHATKLMERSLNFLRSYVPRWADQDVLNVVSAGRWAELDPAWNQTSAFYWGISPDYPYGADVVERVRDRPFVVHFAGPVKPWAKSLRPSHPRRDLFFEYACQTAWSDWNTRWMYLLFRARYLLRSLLRPLKQRLLSQVQ